jgi:chorismate--pyruvate lyase
LGDPSEEFMNELVWSASLDSLGFPVPPVVDAYLSQHAVLSRGLKQNCRLLEVQILSQEFTPGFTEEHVRLNIATAEHNPWVRQVLLVGDNCPLSYGRVVVPYQTYLNNQEALDKLGNQLIGESLLYQQSQITRSAFEYVRVSKQNILFNFIGQQLGNTVPQETLWGRRSVFTLNTDPLLVMEILLPGLFVRQ